MLQKCCQRPTFLQAAATGYDPWAEGDEGSSDEGTPELGT